MQKYFHFIPWAIILILIIWVSVGQCSKQEVKQENHESEYKAEIERNKAEIIATIQRETYLKEKVYSDSLKSIALLQAYKRENKALRKQIEIARVPVDTLIKADPFLNEFVSLQDSLLEVQSARIDTLDAEKMQQWQSFNSLLKVSDQKFDASHQINLNLDKINKDLSKQVKRERLRKTFWKASALILGGGLVAKSLGSF